MKKKITSRGIARGLRRSLPFALAAACGLCAFTCIYSGDNPDLAGRDVRLTILHTSDIHSRILPYEHTPMYTEEKLGLVGGRGPYGGIARVSHIIQRERKKAGRSLYVDSGDLFQGAPIFNLFHGEPEIRALNLTGVDVFAMGNHEFDFGPTNIVDQFQQWAGFPVLAANYEFDQAAKRFAGRFDELVRPWVVFNLHGLEVGVIGMGNTSSMTSLEEGGNSMGIIPFDAVQTVQAHVNALRAEVDVLIMLSHLGLGTDELVGRNVCGLDLILGGHHHVALDPPKVIPYDPDPEYVSGMAEDGYYDMDEEGGGQALDAAQVCPDEWRRDVIMAHPQAFSKFVARLDLVVRDGRIRSHRYELFPVDNRVPQDPDVLYLLEDYVRRLYQEYDLGRVVTYASRDVNRFGTTGGDSMLGNLVAEAMQYRKYVETDFAMTNSLGMRTNILGPDEDGGEPRPVTLETMFNVLPFENTITTMYLSGAEVQEMLDYATRRSAGRGCSSQIQVSNLGFTMNCRTGVAEDVVIAGEPMREDKVYEMATNNYIAWGGSGFEMLKRNTTKIDTGISMRDAVIDYIRDYDSIPVCFEVEQDTGQCARGIGFEDGRIEPTY
ncbi:MAG: bifunctional UDP-sugar hydrolase/5'-nucleotidase [Polyangia bacterium]